MNELNKQTEQPDLASASASGIARRRMILASLGKGSAVVAAAAVPMSTLAAIGGKSITADGRLCTMSGNMSMPHSSTTATEVCSGFKPSYYSDITKWPNYNASSNPDGYNTVNVVSGSSNVHTLFGKSANVVSDSFDQNTQFRELFGDGSPRKLIEILKGSAGTSADEAVWIAAVLDGTIGSKADSYNFPYTAAEVISLYESSKRQDALKFFRNFVQTRL